MKGRKPTKPEEQRFDQIQERGCVPCFLEARLSGRRWEPEPCDIHHTNGKDNHLETYGNCPWHHRGVPKNDARPSAMTITHGPSLAVNPGRYRARYGTEADLLSYQDVMLIKSVHELQEGK